MNTIPRAGWMPVLLLFAAGWLSAQKSTLNEDLVKADRQFDLYAYNLAMQTYQQVLKEDSRNAHALARIGDCYFQLNNPEKSLEWYQKAIRQYNSESDVTLRYGKALMQTGDYEGARDQFMAYAETDETVGNHYANACENAIRSAKKESAWQVKNEALNTEFADFCPAFLGSRIVYSSSRTDVSAKIKAADSPSGSQNFLLVTQQNPESGLLQKPQILRSELQNSRNEGPASFSADGSRVAFCRNNFINGTRQIAESGINMSLYTADVDENGKWKNIKAFPYNGSNYATGFPALSPDGNTMIFASTQPGGFGGWDIYVSNLREGAWSTPRNLGTPLNTPGNEVTPFFDGEDLYFSSDWHDGFGGLDIFRAELGREEVSNVFHLGLGVNSERDDYGFIYSSNDNVGYVTSTRPGGRGNEDIWKVTKKWNDEVAENFKKNKNDDPYKPSEYDTPNGNDNASDQPAGLHLLITDDQGNPLSGAEVDLSDCYGEKGYTNRSGKFSFEELSRTIECNVVIKKSGFQDTEIKLTSFGKKNIKIALTPESRMQFSGRVYDARSKAPVRGVTVQIAFQDGTPPIETVTEADGSYALFLDPESTYLINYSKYGYVSQISKTYLSTDMERIPNILLEKEDVIGDSGYEEYNSANLKPIEHGTEGKKTTMLQKKQTTVPVEEPKAPAPASKANKFNGYSIQLAAMPDDPTDDKLRKFEPTTKHGNLYVKEDKNLYKVRLGIYKTKGEADGVLKKLIAAKYTKDAFIVEEFNADESLIVGNEINYVPVEHDTPTPIAPKGAAKSGALYSLELGTYSSEKTIAISDYANLRGLGNLYSNTQSGSTKVRLGIYSTTAAVEKAKKEVVARGFTNAVVVMERADDPDIQEFILDAPTPLEKKNAKMQSSKGTEAAIKPQVYDAVAENKAKPYYIRIAALANPERFDGASLQDLGSIEKRKPDNASGMTVILLGSYDTHDAADAVLTKVQRRGYAGAYILKDTNGKLVRE